LLTFSKSYTNGAPKFSRLPDSATLAPLRMVALMPHQKKGWGGCIVAAIDCGGGLPLRV
jgi:hypothetical protein